MHKNYPLYKQLGFVLGPVLFIVIYFSPLTIVSPEAQKVIAIAAWMISWWITECFSISITALLPLVLFPMTASMDLKPVAANYASPIVFLFFGGFVIALALEKVMLHKRIALSIIKITGTSANGVIMGFMIATALMSMWISNTASTVVMLPIAMSVIKLLMNDEDGFTKRDKNFSLSIMLGIAFSANIGGMATIIGTPPNSVLVGFLQNEYNIEIGFLQWMAIGLPLSVIILAITYLVLVKWVYPNDLGQMESSEELIKKEYENLGPLSKREKIVLLIFLLTALAWILRSSLNNIFPALNLNDTIISMIGALAMFVIPLNLKQGKFILDWPDTKNLPWGILILFGGGLALANGFSDAGIIDRIGYIISQQEGASIFLITFLLVLVIVFMTELMSNVALVSVFIPVVAGIALGLDANILQLTIPVTLAASCAFMLPMATPPNAIVFASGHIELHQMAKIGIILNIIAIVILMTAVYLFFPLVF